MEFAERQWLGRGMATGLGLLGVLLATPAAHAEEKARLVYVRGAGAESCPAEMDLRLWVIARLGYDPFNPQASRVVLARVEGGPESLRGSVEVVDQQGLSTGRRELSSKAEQCRELARALALSISLALDPERASAPLPAVASKTEPAPALRPAPPQPEVATPARELPAATRLSSSIAIAGSLGTLPEFAAGGVGSVGLRFPDWSLAVEAIALQSLPRDLEPRGQLSGLLIGPALSGCFHVDPVGFCLVGGAALQRLSARGVSSPGASSGVYAGLGPRVAVRVPLGRELGVDLALSGLIDLSRNSARLSDREVWRAPLIGGVISLGLRAHFL